jgi:alpha-tubulin suppressor-like RCC1 family protein
MNFVFLLKIGTMAVSAAALLDMPLEALIDVCEKLAFRDLIRVSATCKRFRHGDGGLETVKLPTKAPVVMALREHAFPGGVGIPSTRPIGCLDSWVAYLARCARQRHCWEAPPVAAGKEHTLFLDAAGKLLSCGEGVGHSDQAVHFFLPTVVPAMIEVRMRSVAAGLYHSLALGWNGRVYSWGSSYCGELGHGDTCHQPSPTLVEGLASVRDIAASGILSLAVTQSGDISHWGKSLRPAEEPSLRPAEPSLRPVIVEGFEGVRMRRVCCECEVAFVIGEGGEVFSGGRGRYGLLGHGDTQNQPSPKRVEALQGVRVSSVAVGRYHALALAEDGLVYAWGENKQRAILGNLDVESELLPKPVEALRGVRVGSIAASGSCSYAVADTGELWAWGIDSVHHSPLGHVEQVNSVLLEPIESLRGIKVDAVAVCDHHTLALADDGSVYAWGSEHAAMLGALGLGPSVNDAGVRVLTRQRIPELRVTCGL